MKNTNHLLTLLFGLLVLPSFSLFSQNHKDHTKSAAHLLSRGIVISESDCASLSEHDFELLSNFDFNNFRNEKTDRSVKIKKGPLVELKSIDFMLANGHQVDDKIILQKQGENNQPNSHSLVTLIDIGAGYSSPENTEKGSNE